MKVEYVDHMGSDLSVVNAARVSFDKESRWEIGEFCEDCNNYHDLRLSEKDQKLIHYLAKNGHWSPFGHTSISLRVKAPIFVARQLGKHQVGLVWNEVSRRYVDEEPEFYTPDYWRARADNVKQGSSDKVVRAFELMYEDALEEALRIYNFALEMKIAPEMARMVLPQSMYTTWIWTGNVASFARVCNLRLDPHTQKETREVAQMISDIVKKHYPVSWEALVGE